MSGGIGPTGSDIALPKEEEVVHKESHEPSSFTKNFHKPTTQSSSSSSRKASFLSFPQLNSLAIIIVLSASGMVSPEDFSFVLFSLFYIYFISKVAFPNTALPPSNESTASNPQKMLVGLYAFAGATAGLFAPIAYILEGFYEGDKEGIKAAAPHVFLLASQVFMEGVAFSDRFSAPIRVFVPVLYNSRRIFTIMDWVRREIYKADEEHSGSDKRIYVGRVLAVANLAYWSFNLFGFLLPVYLPKVFKMYYTEQKEKDS